MWAKNTDPDSVPMAVNFPFRVGLSLVGVDKAAHADFGLFVNAKVLGTNTNAAFSQPVTFKYLAIGCYKNCVGSHQRRIVRALSRSTPPT